MLYKVSTTPARDAQAPAKPTRDIIRNVMRRLGGQRHMTEWARENPTEFYRLYGRTIEKDAPQVNVQVNVAQQAWTFGEKKVEF